MKSAAKWNTNPRPSAHQHKISKPDLAAALGKSTTIITKATTEGIITPDDEGNYSIADITLLMRYWTQEHIYTLEPEEFETKAKAAARRKDEAATRQFNAKADLDIQTTLMRQGELLSAASVAMLLAEAMTTLRVQVSALPDSLVPLIGGDEKVQRLARGEIEKVVNTTLRDAGAAVRDIPIKIAKDANDVAKSKEKKK